jgi:uncharacterized protein YjbJ (UPF0337 family)
MADNQKARGRMSEAKGKAREMAGKITGDRKTEAKGKAEQMKGKGQTAFGKARDKMRGH